MNITDADFASIEAMDERVAKVAHTHGQFIADPETEEGRAQMRSVAAQVTAIKTEIDRYGKALAEPHYAEWKRINEARKWARDRLTEIRDRIRAPADEWEREQREAAGEKVAKFAPAAQAALEDMDRTNAVHAAILEELAAIGVNNGPLILTAILDGRVPHLRIVYEEGEG